MTSRPAITRILSVTRTVPALEAAARFYRDALGFEATDNGVEVSDSEKRLLDVRDGRVFRLEMSLGQQHLTLLEFAPTGQLYPTDSTASDLWFQHCAVVVGDMGRAHAQVMRAGALPISDGGPQHLPANTGGVTAFKFRDPFGHPWELLALPQGAGDPVWHEPSPSLLRGIDHTAISVSALDASRDFYVDVLGLAKAGQTHNRGVAQTRLDAVPDDEVDVLALNPENAPPHVELLAYRTGSRRHLAAVAPADAVVTRTVAGGDVEAIAARLPPQAHPRRGTWKNKPAIAFQDPDGHAWVCVAA